MGNCLFLHARGWGIDCQVRTKLQIPGVCPGGMVTGRIEPCITNSQNREKPALFCACEQQKFLCSYSWYEFRPFHGCRRCLFPFRKRSLPFLTVDAIIGNQAFCHGRCNICSGLSHNKVTNTFLNSLRKNKV